MKQRIQKPVVFIAKSILWSLLLYVVMMLTINWDDVSRTLTSKDAMAVVCDSAAQQIPYSKPPASITGHTGVIKSIVSIVKAISGFASVSVSG
jgi:hypothetical protein